jgi:hypothetical protein
MTPRSFAATMQELLDEIKAHKPGTQERRVAEHKMAEFLRQHRERPVLVQPGKRR